MHRGTEVWEESKVSVSVHLMHNFVILLRLSFLSRFSLPKISMRVALIPTSLPGIIRSTVRVWEGSRSRDGHHRVGTFSPWTFQMARIGFLKRLTGDVWPVLGVVVVMRLEREWRDLNEEG